jgi:TM2 domain-containing membrane protein YozV
MTPRSKEHQHHQFQTTSRFYAPSLITNPIHSITQATAGLEAHDLDPSHPPKLWRPHIKRIESNMNTPAQASPPSTHSIPIGYVLWIFGFTGSHRFYYGRPISGAIWFSTFGLLGVGWLIDAFFIPSMARTATQRFEEGSFSYDVGWVLLTFLGYLGIHRFYMRKWITGVLYLLTGGLFLVGYLYDLWTLNSQISELNRTHRQDV